MQVLTKVHTKFATPGLLCRFLCCVLFTAVMEAVFLPPVYAADEPQVDQLMSVEDAERSLATLLQSQWDQGGFISVHDIKVNEQSLSYVLDSKKASLGLGGLFVGGGSPGHRNYTFAQMSLLTLQSRKWAKHWCIEPQIEPYKKDRLCWENQSDAEQFVAAMNRMIWENSPEGKSQRESAQRAFEDQVAAWRAGGSKVSLPEDAERHKVLAEAALKDKDFQRAADEYMSGLRLYPTWPDGEFNLAVILGESLQRYGDAVLHMKRYLELAPDAPDAEKAKHELWIWQDKSRH